MKRLAIAFLAAALLGGAVSPAGADDTKIIIRGGGYYQPIWIDGSWDP